MGSVAKVGNGSRWNGHRPPFGDAGSGQCAEALRIIEAFGASTTLPLDRVRAMMRHSLIVTLSPQSASHRATRYARRRGHHTAPASSSGSHAATAIIACSSKKRRPGKATVTSSEDSDWQKLSDQVQRALSAAWNNSGMPAAASALYSRWWQLETWLRSLVYLELRSAKGSAWADVLPVNSADRQQKDEEYRHMRTPDAQDQLAYLDAGPLMQLTHDQWQLFRLYLPAQKIWAGRIEELKAIRNRIGHCRKPHGDDLDRLEQTLRDLDGGAFLATSSFNDQSCPNQE
jgi:Swt1-like HEPN